MSVIGRQRLPIVTYLGHCSRAISFFELKDVFFAIGRTTEWADDETTNPEFLPPEPDKAATGLDELIGMKQVSRKLLVAPDESAADDAGTIIWRDNRYKILTTEEAIEKQSRWVYIESEIYFDELPQVDYRQVGVYTRVVRNPGVSTSKTVLLPSEIQNPGLLEVLDNRHVVTRLTDTKEVYSLIIEF